LSRRFQFRLEAGRCSSFRTLLSEISSHSLKDCPEFRNEQRGWIDLR
jgi:hypothetical protein